MPIGFNLHGILAAANKIKILTNAHHISIFHPSKFETRKLQVNQHLKNSGTINYPSRPPLRITGRMDPNNGASVKGILETRSASNPRTRLEVDAFRKYRLDNPDWRVLVTTTRVCRSYPRWANIGLTPKVMPFEFPIAILATREEKRISVIDPTNAHFYENVATPEEGIFYDVAEVVRKNIHYAIKCPCPDSSTCTCSDGWTINFVKCREHPEITKGYPSIIDDKGVCDLFQLIYMSTFEKFIHNGNMDAIAAKPWKNKDTHEMMANKEELNELIYDMEVNLRLGTDAPLTDQMILDLFEPVSIVHCENCGKEETPDCVLKRCARCQKVRYCSLKCQKADWKSGHKENCLPPLKDLGGGQKLFSFQDTAWDPVKQEWILKGMPKKKPKLQMKVMNRRD